MPRALLLSMGIDDQTMKESATVIEVAGLAYVASENPLNIPLGKNWRYLLSGVVWVGYERYLADRTEKSKPMYKYL